MSQTVISGLIWQKIIELSAKHSADAEIIGAICMVESAGNTFAMRYEPEWSYLLDVEKWAKKTNASQATETTGQKTSWGLMQIMGTVAREHGFDDYFPKLCVPEIGLEYGILHFIKFLKQHDDLLDAIASYNAGSPRQKQNGEYVNQRYVDKVLQFHRALKESGSV